MLNKVLRSKKSLSPIPHTWGEYWADIAGNVFKKVDTGELIPIIPVNGMISLTIKNIQQLIAVANLIQLTFKPVYPDDFDFYLSANVGFVDKDPNNFAAENLVWLVSNSEYANGFYRIPGYSRYLINKDGVIFDRAKEFYPTLNYSARDYVLVHAKADHHEGTLTPNVAVHRLMALAFIQYNEDVCKLDVNHIDGNKHNFNLTNLEWVTRLENIVHAINNGLVSDLKMVRVINVITKDITDYKSQSECAKALNICPKLLSWRLLKGNGNIFDNKYIFKSLDVNHVKHKTSPKLVVIINKKTFEITEVNSLAKAADFINIQNSALKKRYARNALDFEVYRLFVYSPAIGEKRPTKEIETFINSLMSAQK